MTIKTAIAAIAIISSFTANSMATEGTAIFESAKKYTVKIKTTVKWPFHDERRGTSKGSGFLIDKERGWILTNAHVAAKSPSTIVVSFIDGNNLASQKVYVDPFLDLAVISVDPKKIPDDARAAVMDCSFDPLAGTPVGAMGHPGGFSFTGTKGIISGTTARLDSEFMQTDAPINPGNSGGPLISEETGKIVGINTAIISGSQNTNFAISSKYACTIAALLLKGSDPSPIETGLVFYKDMEEENKLRVALVRPDSPFEAKEGDTVIAAGSMKSPPKNETQLMDAIRGSSGNSSMTVRRLDGSTAVLLAKTKPEPHLNETRGVAFSGMLVVATSKSTTNDVPLPMAKIEFIESGSPSEAAEFSKNDFVESIDGQRLLSLASMFEILDKKDEAKASVKIRIKRMGGNRNGLFHYIEKEIPHSKPKWISGELGEI